MCHKARSALFTAPCLNYAACAHAFERSFSHVISHFARARALSTRLSSHKDQGSIRRSQGKKTTTTRHDTKGGAVFVFVFHCTRYRQVRWAAVGGETLKACQPRPALPHDIGKVGQSGIVEFRQGAGC